MVMDLLNPGVAMEKNGRLIISWIILSILLLPKWNKEEISIQQNWRLLKFSLLEQCFGNNDRRGAAAKIKQLYAYKYKYFGQLCSEFRLTSCSVTCWANYKVSTTNVHLRLSFNGSWIQDASPLLSESDCICIQICWNWSDYFDVPGGCENYSFCTFTSHVNRCHVPLWYIARSHRQSPVYLPRQFHWHFPLEGCLSVGPVPAHP